MITKLFAQITPPDNIYGLYGPARPPVSSPRTLSAYLAHITIYFNTYNCCQRFGIFHYKKEKTNR